MDRLTRVGLLGDDRGHRSHQELNALIPRLLDEFGVAMRWIPTDSDFDVTAYDGIWLAPGSPYADDGSVLAALRRIRAEQIPFLGTCGGLQYAVIEFLRTELRMAATHAESDGLDDNNAVGPLACSLVGVSGLVTPVPGTRFAGWAPEPFIGMHFCSYGVTRPSLAMLQRHGVVIGATGEGVEAEVLEFPEHPFYVVSLFQPQIGASSRAPVHPLIRAFLKTASRQGGQTSNLLAEGRP